MGADLNLPALLESPGTLAMFPVLLAAAFVVKMVPAAVFLPFFGRRRVFAGGFLLSARLSLIIAAAMIGRDQGAISEAMNAAVVLLAVATCTIAPLGFRALVPRQAEERHRIVVMGCRHLAELLGRRLQDLDWPEGVKVIGIVRGGEQVVPDNRTRLRADDRLTLVGGSSQVERALRQVRRENA